MILLKCTNRFVFDPKKLILKYIEENKNIEDFLKEGFWWQLISDIKKYYKARVIMVLWFQHTSKDRLIEENRE